MKKNAQAKATAPTTSDYRKFLAGLKQRVRSAQLKAALSVNSELIKLYWDIGKEIAKRQEKEGWGSNIIDKIGKDLQNAFPGIEGFSRSNVFRMKALFLSYEKVAQAARQFEAMPIFNIPWGHNIILIEKIKEDKERLWYARQTIENGWSRSTLSDWLKADLFNRKGKAVTNFKEKMPPIQSVLAEETLKDPYNFDFLTLANNFREKELEQGLIDHIQKVLIGSRQPKHRPVAL